MANWRHFCAIAVLLVTAGSKVWAEPLIICTENYPPYNFIGADGTVEGTATANVRQILDEAGVDYSIRLLPWARAMNFAQTHENALIFSLTRTPGREAQFDWLAPLAESSFYLHARADDMRIFTPETIRSGHYTGACLNNDLACEMLLWAGMPAENIFPISSSSTADFRMVIAGRADLYVSDVSVSASLRRSKGYDPSLTKPVMKLSGKTGYYLAAGMHVPVAVRDKIKAAYARLKAQDTYVVIPLSPQPE